MSDYSYKRMLDTIRDADDYGLNLDLVAEKLSESMTQKPSVSGKTDFVSQEKANQNNTALDNSFRELFYELRGNNRNTDPSPNVIGFSKWLMSACSTFENMGRNDAVQNKGKLSRDAFQKWAMNGFGPGELQLSNNTAEIAYASYLDGWRSGGGK